MKISAIITFALIGLATAQDFRKQNADDAEKKTQDFKKLTPDSPCKDGDLACVKDQFAQCANGKFVTTDCGGGLKCVVLPLVNRPGTSVTCSTEQDRLNRLAEARGESPKDNGKGKENIKMPGNDNKGNDNAGKGKDDAGNGNDNAGNGNDNAGNGNDNAGKGKDDAGKGNDNAGYGNDNAGKGKDDAGKGKGKGNGNDNADKGNGNGKGNDNADKGNGKGDGNDNADKGNGKGNGKDDAGKGNGKGNDNADKGNGKGNGNDNADKGKGKGNDNADKGNGKGDGNDNAGKGNDNAAQPPENPKGKGSGNLAEIRKKNADEADKLNEGFKKLTPDSPCKDGDQACVKDQFAQCVNGKFVSTDCGPGLKCAALPLVLKEGTSIACTSEADRKKRIDDARNNRK